MTVSQTPCVATIVASPETPVLTDALVTMLAGALPHAGTPRWLAPGMAADIPFVGVGDRADTAGILRRALSQAGVAADVIVQPIATRRKRLFLADMDSTMIGQECIDELADCVGLKDEVSRITERAMRGELAFEPALKERVALLAGLPVGIVDTIIGERITLTPGGRVLVATMRAHGGHTCLVSGGFTLFAGPVAAMIGFDESRANRLVVENGRLAGRVEEPILGREAKRLTLMELRSRLSLAPHETLAVGDGANDLAMLGEAGLGIAFRAKPAVAAAAHARLEHADLTALLYAQGYRRDEFVA